MGFASRAEQSPRSRHEISSALVARSALDRVERTLASPDSAVEASSTSSRGGSSSSISSILGPMVWRVCWNSAGDLAGRRQSGLFFEKRRVCRFFFGNRQVRLSGISTSRALDARRSTLDRVPPDALFLIACSRRVSVHYNIIERYSFHANFSASRSHLSTAAAGTSPLSPPCSTHVSLGLGGGASAPSPPPALGGSPKNLMA